jgi:hypothetical protein
MPRRAPALSIVRNGSFQKAESLGACPYPRVVLNIAEGASRSGNKEFRKHLGIARGSLDEIEAILDLVRAFEYVDGNELTRIEAVRDECARTVFGLMRKLGDQRS